MNDTLPFLPCSPLLSSPLLSSPLLFPVPSTPHPPPDSPLPLHFDSLLQSLIVMLHGLSIIDNHSVQARDLNARMLGMLSSPCRAGDCDSSGLQVLSLG